MPCNLAGKSDRKSRDVTSHGVNPKWATCTGTKMSIIRKKHGGAHGITHEKQQQTIRGVTGHGNRNNRSLLIEKNAVGNVLHIQDGGQMSEISESHVQQLLGSEPNSSSVKAETAVTANPEWIKSALDQLGPIYSVSTSQIDDKQLTNDVCFENVATHVSGVTEILYPVQSTIVSETSTSGSSVASVRASKTAKNTKTLINNNIQVSTTNKTSSLYGGRCDSLNNRQVAGLDDLQDVPNLHINNKEILQSAKLDLCDMDQDQSTPLIIPQELDKTLEFGESVASKSTLEDTASELDHFVSSIGSDELDSELAYLEQDGGIEKSVGNVNLDIFKNSKNATASSDKNDKDSNNDSSEPPSMATISISTDKTTNTTQILINTGHGQQLFQINTADLAQATTAIEPLALQGGMVGFDSNGQVLNTGTVDGITVQDGKGPSTPNVNADV